MVWFTFFVQFAIVAVCVCIHATDTADTCTVTLPAVNSSVFDTAAAINTQIEKWMARGLNAATICLTSGDYYFNGIVTVPANFSFHIIGGRAQSSQFITTIGSTYFLLNFSESMSLSSIIFSNYLNGAVTGNTVSFEADNVFWAGFQYGAINIDATNFVFRNSGVRGNSAMEGPGAITVNGLKFGYITNSVFEDNTAAAGDPGGCCAGVSLSGVGEVIIDSSIFSGNSAPAGGGGLITTGLAVTITNSSFLENSVGWNIVVWGGAISLTGGSLNIVSSNFSQNSASCGGPAIAASAYSSFVIVNSTFEDNNSIQDCLDIMPVNGTILYHGVVPTLFDVTFSGNWGYTGHNYTAKLPLQDISNFEPAPLK